MLLFFNLNLFEIHHFSSPWQEVECQIKLHKFKRVDPSKVTTAHTQEQQEQTVCQDRQENRMVGDSCDTIYIIIQVLKYLQCHC